LRAVPPSTAPEHSGDDARDHLIIFPRVAIDSLAGGGT
jgi:hypothetical protein